MKKSRRPIAKQQVVKNIATVSAAEPAAETEAEAEFDEELVIQFGELEVNADDISAKVLENFKQNGHEEKVSQVKIYVKPEDNKAYYVINEEITGDVDLA